jgi:hypothetical protein
MTIVVTQDDSTAAPSTGMTFLQMARRVRQECGIAGDGPSAVTGQSGIYAKIVNWVLSAHEEIQLKHQNWRFDWAQLTTALAAQESFTPLDDWSISVRQWDERDEGAYIYPTASGVNARAFLTWMPYDSWRALPKGQPAGYPRWVTQAPDKTVKFYPTPAALYTVVMDYWRKPEVLAANNDIPRMPLDYQM